MIINGQIKGSFTGFNGSSIFELTNGQIWQQSAYLYKYHYAYRPRVLISPSLNGGHVMGVEGMNQSVRVVRVYSAADGAIISNFTGFDYGARFEFQNGQIWEQIETKYKYHYAYRPHAIVVNGINGNELAVEGVDVTVKVKRAY